MNIGRCRACGKILWSKSRHDFQSCGCVAGSFVDGGDDYCRAGGEFEGFTKEQVAKLRAAFGDETISLWEKAKEESRACGVCGGVNWFRAGVAFDAALGNRAEGTVTG